MVNDPFRCYLVQKGEDKEIQAKMATQPISALPEGEVLIQVGYSSLNYKDALAATGHPGVVRSFPHIPGIDAAGVVVESSSPTVQKDDPVIVTSYELGAGQWGGWAELIRVPAEWVVPLPEGLTLESAMALGTAGLTAALSVDALKSHQISPDRGEIVVTGATGGVGILAVKLLARLGYSVVAVTGKEDKHEWLQSLGASRVVGRDAVSDDSDRPLLKAQWAGAIDCVGGSTLATILRSTDKAGCVTACGLVGGADIPTTVYPFILRGITLAGIDSAWYPAEGRGALWRKLADEWQVDGLESLTTTIPLEEIDASVQKILKGGITGRIVVRIR